MAPAKSNMDNLEETLREHVEEITEKNGSRYYISGVKKALTEIAKLKAQKTNDKQD